MKKMFCHTFFITLFLSCFNNNQHSNSSKADTDINTKEIKLKKILNDIVDVKSLLIFAKDKLTIVIPQVIKRKDSYFIKEYTSFGDATFVLQQKFSPNAYKDSLRRLSGNNFKTINIEAPEITYITSNLVLPDSLNRFCFESEKMLRQQVGNLDIYICRGSTKSIIYKDMSTGGYGQSEIFGFPYEVRDFFLYNLTGDDMPELIILSNSTIARDKELVNIDIFRIE
jgi:hypothetical protein